MARERDPVSWYSERPEDHPEVREQPAGQRWIPVWCGFCYVNRAEARDRCRARPLTLHGMRWRTSWPLRARACVGKCGRTIGRATCRCGAPAESGEALCWNCEHGAHVDEVKQ